jgi:hemerythrin
VQKEVCFCLPTKTPQFVANDLFQSYNQLLDLAHWVPVKIINLVYTYKQNRALQNVDMNYILVSFVPEGIECHKFVQEENFWEDFWTS